MNAKRTLWILAALFLGAAVMDSAEGRGGARGGGGMSRGGGGMSRGGGSSMRSAPSVSRPSSSRR